MIAAGEGGVAGRLLHLHGVGAGGEATEAVFAVGISGGGHRRAALADPGAVAIKQEHRGAGDAGFADFLDAVGIEVFPHRVAEGGGAVETRIEVCAALAGGKGDGCCLAVGINIGIHGVVAALVLGGEQVAVGFDHLHAVGAGAQVLEAVGAVATGGGGHRNAVLTDPGAIDIGEKHLDPANAGFGAVLETVGVAVFPNEVADVHRSENPSIQGVIGLSSTQSDHAGQAAAIRIGIDAVVAARIGAGEYGAGGLVTEEHAVFAGGEVGEAVDPVGSGGGGAAGVVAGGGKQAIGTAALERHREACEAGGAIILEAIAIGIDPETIANRSGEKFAEVDAGGVGAGGEGDGADQIGANGAATGAGGILAIEVGGRLGFGDGVGAGAQGREAVAAVGGGDGGGID